MRSPQTGEGAESPAEPTPGRDIVESGQAPEARHCETFVCEQGGGISSLGGSFRPIRARFRLWAGPIVPESGLPREPGPVRDRVGGGWRWRKGASVVVGRDYLGGMALMRYAPGLDGRALLGMPRSPCQSDQSRLSKCAGSFIRCSTLALPSTRIPSPSGLKDGMLQCCAKYLSISAAS